METPSEEWWGHVRSPIALQSDKTFHQHPSWATSRPPDHGIARWHAGRFSPHQKPRFVVSVDQLWKQRIEPWEKQFLLSGIHPKMEALTSFDDKADQDRYLRVDHGDCKQAWPLGRFPPGKPFLKRHLKSTKHFWVSLGQGNSPFEKKVSKQNGITLGP